MKRETKSLSLFCLTAVTVFGMCAHAQDPAQGYKWPEHPWHTHKLTPNVYWIEGGGGNSGVLVGTHEIVIFDAKTTLDTGKQLLAKVAEISQEPISTVILSHSDVDHVGGLRAFPKNISVIAQENDLKELQADVANNPGHALPAELLPNKTVGDKQELVVDGMRMQLFHWVPAHTSGDLMLYLPAEKILFTGDIITENRAHPLIHMEKGGSSEGWVQSVKGALKLDVERYVPGHGDVVTRTVIEKMLRDVEIERDQIKKMVAQGKSLKEIQTALDDPSAEEAHGPPFAPFSEVVYRELTK